MLGRIILFIVVTASNAWAVGAPVRIDGGDTITQQADIGVTATPVLVKASNANRATLNCTTTAAVRWGPTTVTSTTGQILLANSSIAISNTAAIYMAAVDEEAVVSCTEESWANVSSGSGVFSP